MENGTRTYIFQRKMLGILCGLLPITSVLFGLIGSDQNPDGWYKSVSATYYATSKICMIGLLFSASVFFFSYKGYDWRDRTLAFIQAICSLGIVVFPCRIPVDIESVGMFNLPMPVSNIIHGTCAAILFLSFGINILFLFTLGDESRQEKKKRNRVYRICAYIIFGLFALECISKIPFIHNTIPVWFPTTWVNELFMLEAFAVAWLVKAEAIAKFNDKEEN